MVAMNKLTNGPWGFRWGKRMLRESLGRNLPGASLIPGRLFRGAKILGPVLAWIAGIAVHDLRQPQSRIKSLGRRMAEKRNEPKYVRTEVIGTERKSIEYVGEGKKENE